jgi:hypothetical protein
VKSELYPLVVFALLLSGCLGYKPFQPPPYDEERWRKSGLSNDEVVKALLECGFKTPRGRLLHRGEGEMTLNEVASSIGCMEKNGFISNYEDSWVAYCRAVQDQRLPACLDRSLIFHRDVNRRLNSDFCHDFPKSNVCIK